MEENIKLEKIKKSCKVGEKVTLVFCIILTVGCVLSLISGIWVASQGKKYDEMVTQAESAGYVSTGIQVGSVKMMNIDLGDVTDFKSGIPSVQKAIEDHPYSVLHSMYCFVMAFLTAVFAVLMKLIESVFSLVRKEDSPFTEKVMKRLLVVMIAISVILFFVASIGFAALGLIITWVVYTIMDYGRVLQIQSDETL